MTAGRVRWWACCFGLLLAVPGLAQDERAAPAEEEAAALEEVLVTGTRIRRSKLDAPSPVLVIDARLLADSGFSTLGEFARYLPQNADVVSDAANNGRTTVGTANFNLRGIGADGTLTLLNGRRVAPFGSSGDDVPFVDINAIPVAAIERIEILKDGASAIYGSEAVAGVVNIITRSRMDGAAAEAGFLTTAEGDGDEWDASVSGGWNGGATAVVGTLSWLDRDVIWSRDRAFSGDVDLSDRGGYNGRLETSSPPTVGLLDSDAVSRDPACPEYSDINNIYRFDGQEKCLFNYAAFTMMQQPATRWAGLGSLRHAFSDAVEAYAELFYSRNRTRSVMAPTPLRGGFYTVLADHPDNPFGEDLILSYRMLDAGDRGFDVTSTTWRAVAELRGSVGEWNWRSGLMRSEAESENTRFNGVLRAAFQDALRGRGGPNGDQYYNPFGLNPENPPEVIDRILVSGTGTELSTTENAWDAQLDGRVRDLPGGPAGVALGVQWRRQELDQYADEEELSGMIAGSAGILPLVVNRSIGSAFGELLLPLLPSLEAQLALRYDHYSDFGSTTNPKIGLGWRPLEDLLLRLTWGTSFRPPGFRELFHPSFEDFGLHRGPDPWRCPITGSLLDCDARPVIYTSGGNPGLQPDEGETWLLGMAWEPVAVPGLYLALDLWEIENRNRIVFAFDGSQLQEEALYRLPPDQNPFFDRAAPTPEDIALGMPGRIIGVNQTFVNAGKVTTRGLDFETRYRWSTRRAGDFTLSLNYAYLDTYEVGEDAFGVVFRDDWAGAYGFESGLPRSRANLGLRWAHRVHAASGFLRYSGDYRSYINRVVDEVETDQPFKVDSYEQIDLQYAYRFTRLRDAELRVGCQNCLDADPPVYNYSNLTEPFHEGRGLIWYLRWSQPFGL